jgi:hypothetical protein
MAEHKVQGGDMLLFIDPTGGTDYDIVVCLTSVGISDSISVVDASSACGPDKSPGTLEISYSFEGQHLQDPDSGKISGTDLRILLRSETTIGWKIAPESPVTGDEIQEGTGYLSELSSTYAFDSVGTFTGTIQPYGTPTITVFGGGGGNLVVGQLYQGGIIGWLDSSEQHGILMTNANNSGTMFPDFFSTPFSNPSNTLLGANGTAWGSGTTNTSAIIAGTTSSLALSCTGITIGGFTDWVMPSLDDMLNIFSNQGILNIYDNSYYTSTEIDANLVKVVELVAGVANVQDWNKGTAFSCFAVRYF